jgi:hypothetical protein
MPVPFWGTGVVVFAAFFVLQFRQIPEVLEMLIKRTLTSV